jgi:hypothetical protein
MATKALKEQLIKELEKLPAARLREALDFVGYVISEQKRETEIRKSYRKT